jgi:UDP-N-acetyl-2-amino-2-deoxyglucuronate dehydrogenase
MIRGIHPSLAYGTFLNTVNNLTEGLRLATEKLGFGIIGCGMISGWHAEAISRVPRARLVGVTDAVAELRNGTARKYEVNSYESVEKMLADPEVRIVSICTPSGLHAPLAIRAAQAGKHVIVEKPMAINLKDADQMIETCERNRVKLCVISQLRFSPAIQQIKQALEESLLGRVVLGDLYMKFNRSQEYYDKGNWRGTWEMDGGGALMNQGIHGVDLLRYLMGPVKSVSAHARTLARKIAVEDTAVAILEFQNGAVGVIEATTSVYPGSSRHLEINGHRGTVVLEENSIVRWDIEGQDPAKHLTLEPAISNTSSNPGAFGVEGHVYQITDMVEAILEDRRPAVDGMEGRNALEIILAVYRSSSARELVLL